MKLVYITYVFYTYVRTYITDLELVPKVCDITSYSVSGTVMWYHCINFVLCVCVAKYCRSIELQSISEVKSHNSHFVGFPSMLLLVVCWINNSFTKLGDSILRFPVSYVNSILFN